MSRLKLAAAAVLTTLIGSLAVAASPAMAAELAVNGGFESGSLSPWSCTGWPAPPTSGGCG